MNILAINWRCIKNPEAGGAEIHFHEIFKRISAKGNNVTLIAHQFKDAPVVEIIDGIKTIRIGNKFFFDKQFRKKYLKEFVKEDFDLIVDDISKIPLFTPNYINKPIVGILHHIHGNSLYKEIPFPMAYYIIRAEKKIPAVYKNTPIFVVSESTKKELTELGQPEEKIDILYNAIDHELFSKIKVEKSEEPLLVYVGRIKKYKNIENIIDAVKIVKEKIPGIKFKIGGRGDHLENLKKYVEQKGLQKEVEFLGFLTEKEKAKLLGEARLFVTMALKEGWGITEIEANAMATPVIGSDVPGLRDSIINNKTGLLVKLNDPEVLADNIFELFYDKKRLKQMSGEAKIWASKFTWENSADHFLKKTAEWYPELKM